MAVLRSLGLVKFGSQLLLGSRAQCFFDESARLAARCPGEAFGLYLLESMASGVPVVQPKLGAFPEIVEKSYGGIIYENNTPEVLASALKDLLSEEDKLHELSLSARKGVENEFNIYAQTDKLIGIYTQFLNKS